MKTVLIVVGAIVVLVAVALIVLGSVDIPAPSGQTSSGLDQVVLPGGGTFAGTLSGPGQPLQTFSLLTDQGLRYPVPTADDIAKLGYGTKDATPIPANLLQLFKEGPTLTSSAAQRPVPAK